MLPNPRRPIDIYTYMYIHICIYVCILRACITIISNLPHSQPYNSARFDWHIRRCSREYSDSCFSSVQKKEESNFQVKFSYLSLRKLVFLNFFINQSIIREKEKIGQMRKLTRRIYDTESNFSWHFGDQWYFLSKKKNHAVYDISSDGVNFLWWRFFGDLSGRLKVTAISQKPDSLERRVIIMARFNPGTKVCFASTSDRDEARDWTDGEPPQRHSYNTEGACSARARCRLFFIYFVREKCLKNVCTDDTSR